MMQIAATRYTDDLLQHVDWKKEWEKNARMLYRSARKGAEIPALVTDALKEYLEGQATVNIDLHSSEDLSFVVFSSVGISYSASVSQRCLFRQHHLCDGYDAEGVRYSASGIWAMPLLAGLQYFADGALHLSQAEEKVRKHRRYDRESGEIKIKGRTAGGRSFPA